MKKEKYPKKWWVSLTGLLLIVAISAISYSVSAEGKVIEPEDI